MSAIAKKTCKIPTQKLNTAQNVRLLKVRKTNFFLKRFNGRGCDLKHVIRFVCDQVCL